MTRVLALLALAALTAPAEAGRCMKIGGAAFWVPNGDVKYAEFKPREGFRGIERTDGRVTISFEDNIYELCPDADDGDELKSFWTKRVHVVPQDDGVSFVGCSKPRKGTSFNFIVLFHGKRGELPAEIKDILWSISESFEGRKCPRSKDPFPEK
jgi:hypothetical protein